MQFEVYHNGKFISCDTSFMEIFKKRFKELVDRSGEWIYFVGQQEGGTEFLYRLEK